MLVKDLGMEPVLEFHKLKMYERWLHLIQPKSTVMLNRRNHKTGEVVNWRVFDFMEVGVKDEFPDCVFIGASGIEDAFGADALFSEGADAVIIGNRLLDGPSWIAPKLIAQIKDVEPIRLCRNCGDKPHSDSTHFLLAGYL